MAWLHTWGGLLMSWLLFVIVFTGTLSCFDKEIDYWMQSQAHGRSQEQVSFDAAIPQLQRLSPHAHAWWLLGPTERKPLMTIGWENDGEPFQTRSVMPATGKILPPTAGGEFFLSLHYSLHSGDLGIYLVGIAGWMMLVSLISGIIIHRRIFADFFTFRPRAGRQRTWLDAHNLTGVLALPFHLVMAYTGLAIFATTYMPAGLQAAYQGDVLSFFEEAMDFQEREKTGQPLSEMASVDAMVIKAQVHWEGGRPWWVSIHHPDDTSALVDVRRTDPASVAPRRQIVTFDAQTGELLHRQEPPDAAYRTHEFMVGMHMVQFGNSGIRWLYFIMGLAGSVMIAGGLMVWVVKREGRLSTRGARRGYTVVRALNLGILAGLPLASAAYFWANRLLPADLAGRADWEVGTFFAAWFAAALWGALRLRAGQPWAELLGTTAGLLVGAPLLNALTTENSHLIATLARGDWRLAGVDLTLLVSGTLLAFIARRCMIRRSTVKQGHIVKPGQV